LHKVVVTKFKFGLTIHGFEQADASTVNEYGHAPSVTEMVNTSADGTGKTIFCEGANVPTSTILPTAFEIEYEKLLP
jgi:hypothetical protein